MKNIIIALLLVVVGTTAFSQDEFESYSFKTPTLYAYLGLHCGEGYTSIFNINNGGYYLKRVGLLWCDDDCGGYLPIDTPGTPWVQKVEYTQGITYNGFYGDLTFAENIRCWYKGFAETNYGIEYTTYTSQQVSPLCNVTPPTVTTCSVVSNITTTSGSTCGQVTSEGGSTLTSWGICYNTSGNPTISSSTISGGANPFAGYYAGFSGLTPSTTYYYRAYASNSGATAYGAEYSFTTLADATIPTVVTALISGLTETSATSGGSITSDGGSAIVVKGIEYSTNASFSSGVLSMPGGDGSGSFTLTMNSLSACTTYYVRAFAANSNGTGYGNIVTFTTNCSCTLPSFSAAYCSNATSSSIEVGASISSDGGCSITNRGFQYSTDPLFNTIIGSVSVGSGAGSYSTVVTGLTCGNTYYFRPFATNSAGTYYANSLVGSGCTTAPTTLALGNQIEFPNYPINPVQVRTGFTNSGCALIERGVVWSTSPNPTISNNKYVSTSNAEGTQTYSISVSPGTYYFSAYAINNHGVSYYPYSYSLTIP